MKITITSTKTVDINLESLTDELQGHPPYDNFSNICMGDGYFAKSLERKYGLSIGELTKIRDEHVGKPVKTFGYKK